MKNKLFKRIFTLMFSFIMSLSSTGCTMYQSEPGEVSEIWGTYKLTTYEKKDENNENYDAISAEGITAYMVINSDRYGYYVYKDSKTSLWYDSCIVTYNYEEEDGVKTDLVKAIDVNLGYGTVYIWNKKPGCGDEPTMGFDVKKHTLSYTIPSETITLYDPPKEVAYQKVVYTKISDDKDLTKVRNELGLALPDLVPYSLRNLGDYLYLSSTGTSVVEGKKNPNFNDDNTAYKYKYVVLDLSTFNNNEFTVHYATTDNPDTDLVAKGTFELDATKGDVPLAYLTVLDLKYDVSLGSSGMPGSFLSRSVWTDVVDDSSTMLYTEIFSKYTITAEANVNDVIAYAKTIEIFETIN